MTDKNKEKHKKLYKKRMPSDLKMGTKVHDSKKSYSRKKKHKKSHDTHLKNEDIS